MAGQEENAGGKRNSSMRGAQDRARHDRKAERTELRVREVAPGPSPLIESLVAEMDLESVNSGTLERSVC